MTSERPEPQIRLSMVAEVMGLAREHFSIAYGRLVVKSLRLPGLRLAEVDLGDIDFVEADLRGATFVGTNLGGADFTGGSLAGASFESVDAEGLQFTRTDLRAATFQDSTLHDSVFEACAAKRASFAGAGLVKASFRDCVFVRAQLRGAHCQKAMFVDSDLRGASFAAADLRGTGFMDCDLRGVNLDGARFSHTSFITCAMAGVSGQPRVEGGYVVSDADLSGHRGGSVIAPDELFHTRWDRPPLPEELVEAFSVFQDVPPDQHGACARLVGTRLAALPDERLIDVRAALALLLDECYRDYGWPLVFIEPLEGAAKVDWLPPYHKNLRATLETILTTLGPGKP